jgi:hypothetical protein
MGGPRFRSAKAIAECLLFELAHSGGSSPVAPLCPWKLG